MSNPHHALLSFVFLLVVGLAFAANPGQADKDTGKPKKPKKLTVINKAKALYPEEALEKGIQGNVEVYFTVDKMGKVVKSKAVSGPELLRQPALDALQKTLFSNTARKNLRAHMTYFFRLLDPDETASDAVIEQTDIAMSAEEKGLQLIDKAEPIYPQEAKDKGVKGEVAVEVKVNENGEVIEAEVKDGPEILHEAAIDAAKKYRFYNPQKRQSVIVTITISFEL